MGEFRAICRAMIVGEILQFRRRHQVIEQAGLEGPRRRHRQAGNKHLPGQGQADHIDDVQDAGGIVGHPQSRRGDGKGGLFRADEDVADHGQLDRAPPDAALQHGDHRRRTALDGPDGLLQGIVVGQRVPAGLGKFG